MQKVENKQINKILSESFVIPKNRLKHSYAVAQVMYQISKQYYKWNENKCREMYILGLIHDAGYEFLKEKQIRSDHAPVLANLMEKQNYPYHNEILYHDSFTSKYSSDELNLLFLADISVDSNGNIVSPVERLEDLKKRHSNEELQDFSKLVDYVTQVYK